ncbi:MAG: Asp-tRNA(Asn)/Glu-tRNA(Gln) amidotransferase subunit GatA [Opitutales bacterium]|nr:Asp-tRNA(Asn)/Glu-tRNA(Gln) amidotransferase subunit GatA [Opitutales bacterium]
MSLTTFDTATSAVEKMRAIIARCDELEPRIGAFIHRNAEDALAQAAASDERRAAGKSLGPLDGVIVGVKDLISVKGHPLSCASRILENYVSPYDAHVAEKLKAAGAILWGRLNMDEFAMGSSCETSYFQKTHNPWDLERTPGGSSGGSAAAVAAGMCEIALGSDTGGSIRQPAAYCGIVGLKPTYGLVSRYGLAAFASSLDQIGPMGRTVADCAALLQAMAGHDERDSTSLKLTVPDYMSALAEPEKPVRIGLPKEYYTDGVDPEIRAAVDAAVEFYKSRGCEIKEVSLPHTDYAIPVYYIIAPAEASSNLSRYDGVRYTRRSPDAKTTYEVYCKSRGEGFGSEVKRRILLGSYALSSGYYDAYYLRAQKVRTLIRNDFLKAFEDVDVLLTPTTPHHPFRIGEKVDDPLSMYLEDIFTISVNLAGLPGLSMPCGFSSGGLPIGMQLIGKPLDETTLLKTAKTFEQAHNFKDAHPSL